MTEFRIQCIDTRKDDVKEQLDALRQKLSPRGNVVSDAGRQKTIEVFGEPLTPQEVVLRICADIENVGMPALLGYCKSLDGAELDSSSIRVTQEEIEAAHASVSPDFLATVRRIADNIREFQSAILHQDAGIERDGVRLKQRYVPLQRVGICVPGGAAAYPSTVLMTAVPALTAGVKELAVVAPPTDFGANNPDVLATCHELGISEVYRMGGAQAVAALAYGVVDDGSVVIPKVDKIVGPGNLFVALAKKHVYGDVDIDSIAGPSEVVVIADPTTRPDFTASDLLAQAEHAPGSGVLITWSDEVLEGTRVELEKQVQKLSRSSLTRQSLEQFGALIRVKDADEACELTDLIAPEHLHIATDDANALLEKINNAGAAFLGNYSPVALGDYAAGPSHVLPTGGTARWASGLTSNDFLRGGSVIEYSREALTSIAGDIQVLADKEGLTAHRESIDIRVRQDGQR